MLQIKVGDVFSAKDAKHGEGSKGAWYLCPVKAEKGYDKITIWASNPGQMGLAGADSIAIKSIDSVKKSARQNSNDGKWYDEYSITATLEANSSPAMTPGTEFASMSPKAEKELDDLFGGFLS